MQPTRIDRAKIAVARAKYSLQSLASKAVNIFGKMAFGLGWLASLAGTNVNYHAKAGKRYDNSAVMAVIQYLTGGVEGGPRLIVQKPKRGSSGKREWREEDSHQLPVLIEDGIAMDEGQLFAGTILSLIVQGNAYWFKIRSDSGKLLGFAYLHHDRVTAKNDKDFAGRKADGSHPVTYYELSDGDGNSRPVAVEDIVHFRWGLDPLAPQYGLSPIWAAIREIVTDNEAAALMAAMLLNGGVLGWAISPEIAGKDALKVTATQMREQGKTLQSFITGDMAGTPAPLPFPIKVTQLGYEPSKLVLDKQRAMAVERILATVGIDPMVLGLPSQSKTFSNYEEANEAAVRKCLLRVLGIISKALTKQVLYVDFGKGLAQNGSRPRVHWDVSEVPALQPDVDAEHKRGREDFQADLITRKEWREENGYEVDETRDDIFCSEIKASLAQTAAEQAEDEGDADEDSEDRMAADLLRQARSLRGLARVKMLRAAKRAARRLEELEEVDA